MGAVEFVTVAGLAAGLVGLLGLFTLCAVLVKLTHDGSVLLHLAEVIRAWRSAGSTIDGRPWALAGSLRTLARATQGGCSSAPQEGPAACSGGPPSSCQPPVEAATCCAGRCC